VLSFQSHSASQFVNPSQVRDELHVRVTKGEECIEVAPVEGVKGLVEELDVLLRHGGRQYLAPEHGVLRSAVAQ
jgi:hypothetical protein